jgi:hypothetical protein
MQSTIASTSSDPSGILKEAFEVRLFDETEMISEEHKSILNERILDMQTRFNLQMAKF